MLKGQDLEREPLLPHGSDVASNSRSTTPATSEEVLTAEEKIIEKRLIRKLDLSLLLWAQVSYLLWTYIYKEQFFMVKAYTDSWRIGRMGWIGTTCVR